MHRAMICQIGLKCALFRRIEGHGECAHSMPHEHNPGCVSACGRTHSRPDAGESLIECVPYRKEKS